MGRFLMVISEKLGILWKYVPFRDKVSKVIGVEPNASKATFISKTQSWMTANPVKAQAVVASALAGITSSFTEIFSTEQLPVIAKGLQDASGLDSDSVKEQLQSQMGDGIANESYGVQEVELANQAELIKMSLARTNELAQILAIPPRKVGRCMSLIALYEPIDEQIYETLG